MVMSVIESFIRKSTGAGGFTALSNAEQEELSHTSLLAEQYEDNVLKIMPLPVSVNGLT